MAQTIVRNSEGIAITFQTSQIINIRATTEGQLIQVFNTIHTGAINEKKPLALIQTKLSSEHRQINILKAIMISPSYWDELLLAMPEASKKTNVYSLTCDFLLKDDRFNRVLSRLSPKQERKDRTYEILDVLGNGQVDLGVAFSSVDVLGAIPTGDDPDMGIVDFAGVDIGKLVDIAYVTQPFYNVVKITRTHEQVPEGNTGVVHPYYAYVMHPNLATLLGISLPVV